METGVNITRSFFRHRHPGVHIQDPLCLKPAVDLMFCSVTSELSQASFMLFVCLLPLALLWNALQGSKVLGFVWSFSLKN